MQKKTELENKPKKSRGGARPGSGRPKGGTNAVSINGLLEALDKRVPGKKYEDILMEDFLQARHNNDSQLVIKYHNLILNKVMTHVHKIEVTDSQEMIDAKQLAFSEALAKLTGIKKD
jgi:hypothetical protein